RADVAYGSARAGRCVIARPRPIAAPDVCTGRPQLAKADTAFQGASVGQPTEPCLAKLIQHAAERRMLAVLDLDPAIEPAGAIAALAVFRNQAFEPHQAGVPE